MTGDVALTGAATTPAPVARGLRSGFYGWRIVAVLAMTETVSWGVLHYAFAVLLVPMRAELGLSTATLTGAFSLSVLVTGVAAVPVGRWLDRHGPRVLMTVGSAAAALLVVAWSRVETVAGLYAVFAGIGLARAAVLYEPAFAVVVRWFDARRAGALLVITVVAGFASTIVLPATNALVGALGWREALLVLAGVLAVTTVLPHWAVLRRDPADLGLRPDGAPPAGGRPPGAAAASTRHDAAAATPRPGLRQTARWALRDPAYPWFAAAFAANALAVIVVAVHLVPHLREQGHSAAFAALATGSLGALSVSGRLVVTAATRRWPMVPVTAATFGVQAAAVLVLLVAGGTTAGAVVFVVLFGLGFGVATIARPALLAQTYGVARYATLAGLMTVVLTAATTVGPVAAGVARTATGGYTVVLVCLLVLCALASAALVGAGRAATPATGTAERR